MKDLLKAVKRTVKRSQINLNPFNPKRHSEEVVKNQLRNFKKVGLLGGIVWNERTGNLIDGHRRIYALDLYYKYPEKGDYEVECEVVNFDEKTEKEQMTYMAVGNTEADLSMVAEYINNIDVNSIGVDKETIEAILSFTNLDDSAFSIPDYSDLLSESDAEDYKDNTVRDAEEYEKAKQAVKDAKAGQQRKMIENSNDIRSYVVLSFSDYDAKADFLEFLGYDPTETIIKGEEFIEKLTENENIAH